MGKGNNDTKRCKSERHTVYSFVNISTSAGEIIQVRRRDNVIFPRVCESFLYRDS